MIEVDLEHKSPGELADIKIRLAGEYSFVAGQLEEIQVRKPLIWLVMREGHKSDKATDRAWDATEDGRNEIGLGWQIKIMKQLISAINTKVRIAEGEAQNQY